MSDHDAKPKADGAESSSTDGLERTFADHWELVRHGNPTLADDVFAEALARTAWDAAVTACANCVPENWLDPLLTGPNAVVGNLGAHNVEAILKAVKARIIGRSF